MLQYKSIILENVYRTDLPEGFLKNLKTYVKDYGCGLVACGAPAAYKSPKNGVLSSPIPDTSRIFGRESTVAYVP